MSNHPFQPLLVHLLRQAQASQNAFFQRLPADDLAATGTPDFWAAKDHVAHMTYWRQRQALRQHSPQMRKRRVMLTRKAAPASSLGRRQSHPG